MKLKISLIIIVLISILSLHFFTKKPFLNKTNQNRLSTQINHKSNSEAIKLRSDTNNSNTLTEKLPLEIEKDLVRLFKDIAINTNHFDPIYFKYKINNHSRLIYAINILHDQDFSSISTSELKNSLTVLIEALYKDALITIYLAERKNGIEYYNLVEIIQKDFIEPDITLLKGHFQNLSHDYLKLLVNLLTEYKEAILNDNQIIYKALIYQARNLLLRRIRYSDNYFFTIMHDYFSDQRYSLSVKFDFIKSIKGINDPKLINYANSCIYSVLKHEHTSDERLRKEIKAYLGSGVSDD